MKLPRSAVVAGVTIKIVQKDLDVEECFGYWDYDKRTIFLGKSLRPAVLTATLRHELLHASLDLSGISFAKDFQQLDEPVVRAIETHFLPSWERMKKRLAKIN